MKSQFINSNAILNRPLNAQIKHAKRVRFHFFLDAKEIAKGWFQKISSKRRGFADHAEQRRFEENLTQQRMSARIFP